MALDAYGISRMGLGELRVQGRHELAGDVCRRRQHDGPGGERLAVREVQLVAVASGSAADRRDGPACHEGRRSQAVGEAGDKVAHATAQGEEGRPGRGALTSAREQSAGDTPVLAFELPEVRERGSEAELLSVTGVDAAHQRFHEALVGLTAHAARHERGDRLVAGLRAGRQLGFAGEAVEPLGREDPARRQRFEPCWDHPGQARRQRAELAGEPHVCAAIARDARDQVAAEAQFLAQPDAAGLPREEAVGSALDDESAHLLGEDGAAEARPALDEHDLGPRAQALEAQGGSQAGDPAADHDDAAHPRAASHGAPRSSITSTSVAM